MPQSDALKAHNVKARGNAPGLQTTGTFALKGQNRSL